MRQTMECGGTGDGDKVPLFRVPHHGQEQLAGIKRPHQIDIDHFAQMRELGVEKRATDTNARTGKREIDPTMRD
jgi:hypothetical protein